MADNPYDPNPELRAELEAAKAVLEPEIRGLNDLSVVSISADLRGSIQVEAVNRQRRLDLINATLASLDSVILARESLAADGYPELPDTTLPNDQFAELQGQDADLTAAVGVFVQSPATTVTVTLGEPVTKPPAEGAQVNG